MSSFFVLYLFISQTKSICDELIAASSISPDYCNTILNTPEVVCTHLNDPNNVLTTNIIKKLLKIYQLGQRFGIPDAEIARNFAKDPAILPTLRFYHYAIDHNVAVFFITGRPEHARKSTINNLKAVGYRHYLGLYMRPDNYQNASIIPFKAGIRKKIIEAGYDIVVNIGDQYSDLTGGFDGDRTFKYQNNMYYVK